MNRDHHLAVATDEPDVVIDLTYVSTAFRFAASVEGARDSIRTTLRLDTHRTHDSQSTLRSTEGTPICSRSDGSGCSTSRSAINR
jgi:hypothetical protein